MLCQRVGQMANETSVRSLIRHWCIRRRFGRSEESRKRGVASADVIDVNDEVEQSPNFDGYGGLRCDGGHERFPLDLHSCGVRRE